MHCGRRQTVAAGGNGDPRQAVGRSNMYGAGRVTGAGLPVRRGDGASHGTRALRYNEAHIPLERYLRYTETTQLDTS